MHLALRFAPIVLLSLLSLPVFAQEAERPTPAARYGAAAWPAASAARAGLDTGAIKAAGLERVSWRIDARRAEATLGFRPLPAAPSEAETQKKQKQVTRATVLVRVRRFNNAKQARRWLLSQLAACQATLTREEGLGDVGFGWRSEGRLLFAAAAQGNLGWSVRALDRGASFASLPGSVSALAQALDAQARRAPLLSASAPPVLEGHEAAPNPPGKPLAFRLRFSEAPHSLSFAAGPEASVVQARDGFLLYADRAGKVEVVVYAASRDLQVSKHQLVLHPR